MHAYMYAQIDTYITSDTRQMIIVVSNDLLMDVFPILPGPMLLQVRNKTSTQ